MSYLVTKYPHGTFSWCDIFSKDIQSSKKFLESLFGWTSIDIRTGEGRPDYTMFYLNGHEVAGGSPTFDNNMPSFWSSYISVENVDGIVSHVENLEGKIIMPAMDVLDSGRMATIQDPTGAHVNIWQPKKHIGAHIINTTGAMSWNELYTRDMETAKKFYGTLFGWTFEQPEEMEGYTVIKNKGRSNGGIFPITPEMGKMPPCWMVYFTVKNLDESVAKVKALGGHIYMDSKDISVGRIATVTDPTGAGMVLIEMSVKPDEWIE